MKKAVLYARVSSDKQKDEKTIDSQIAVLKERIKADSNILLEEFIDDGWTGETLERPELSRLREKARNSEFEAVYIYHLDRLSRELGNQLFVVGELKRLGIEIYTSQGRLEDDPNNRLLMQMQGIVSEQEKLRILDRTKTGRLQKAKRGVVVGSLAPFGYIYIKKDKNKDGYYLVHKKEADVVKKVFGWFVELKSIRAVTKKLQEEGVESPQKTGKWGKSTVHRILTREDYVGTAYYNKYYAVETKAGRDRQYKKIVRTGRRLRDKNEWVPIQVPSIVDKGVFNLAQLILSRNKDTKRRPTNRQYLLSGLLQCELCNSPYTGNPKKNYLSYRDSNRLKKFPLPKDCGSGMVKTEKIDGIVWESIREAVLNPQLILRHLDVLTNKHRVSIAGTDRKMSELYKHLDTLKQKKDKVLDVYSEGVISKESFIEKINDIAKEVKVVEAELGGLANTKNHKVDRKLVMNGVKHFCRLAEKRIDTFDFDKRKQFINLVTDKILIDTNNKTIRIKTSIPYMEASFVPSGGLSSTTCSCLGPRAAARRCSLGRWLRCCRHLRTTRCSR